MTAMPAPFPIDEPPTACGPTLAAVHAVLDGDTSPAAVESDAHALGCPSCRARVAEARVLLAALALPPQSVTVPSRFAPGVLSAVRADRRARTRRRLLVSVGGGLAVAAAVMVAVWSLSAPSAPQFVVERTRPGVSPAPEPRAVRVSEELAKAGDALRESSRPLAEPAAAAPKVFASLAGAMLPPMPTPMGDDIAPVGASLADLPGAARSGLEPVAGTTQKAFVRLFRDVGAFASARPKS